MKHGRRTDLEEMRYRVPGVRNRFFQVNVKIIAVCMVLCFVAIAFTFALESVKEEMENKPKIKFFYFIKLEDPEATSDYLYLNRYVYEHCFVYYDERCAGSQELDFSWCREKIAEKLTSLASTSGGKNMVVIFSSSGSNYLHFTEEDIPLLGKEIFSVDDVKQLIQELRS